MLLRHSDQDVNPQLGIDQLIRMSLIERITAADGFDFLEVPLATALFCRRKLEISPYSTIIEDDVRFLQDLGAASVSSMNVGLQPRMVSFFRKTAMRILEGNVDIENMRPVLEFLARGYPPAWMLMSDLEE